MTSLVISKSALRHSLTLLIQQRYRKKSRTAAINDVCSLEATLSDLYDDTDTNLLYILLVPKHYCKCVANNMNFNSTLATWIPPSCKRTTCHVTKAAGIDLFSIPKNDSALAGTNRFS